MVLGTKRTTWYVKPYYVNPAYNHYFIDENEASCSISSATIRNVGHYYCQVENLYGKVESKCAKVTVSCNSPLESEKFTTLHFNERLAMSQDFTSSTDLES